MDHAARDLAIVRQKEVNSSSLPYPAHPFPPEDSNMDGKHIVETEKCAGAKPLAMSEERRFAILFAATLLAARKLIPMMEEDRPNMAKDYWT